ncbi:T9SS type A sorting domain-containing protein, partial [Candidatus Parcubacteria bacterium]|nr:T9SS type A sorting domain-containing protein [Candidatus Parcubacteria bacterium]
NLTATDYSIILYQNFENPVRAGTKIQFKLPVIMHVEIVILNVLGQKITTLVNGIGYQGINDVFWNASEYPPGIYFYRIKTSEYIQTKKLLLVR